MFRTQLLALSLILNIVQVLFLVSATIKIGGADRDRTGDPLVANQVLSQLSYSPLKAVAGCQLSVAGVSDN